MRNRISRVYGVAIDDSTADEIANTLNVVNLPDDQLLHAFVECVDNIQFAQSYDDDIDEARLMAAPAVFELYRRAYGCVPIDVRTLPDMVRHRPTSLRFWANEHVIRRVWALLLIEGFKTRKQQETVAGAPRDWNYGKE